ncbi:MAG: transcriptional regulator [Rickettsiales bacterium]|nr:transcriptional regulator [Rickettsiales bacterium]
MFKIQKRIIYAIEAVVDIALNSGLKPVQNISIAKRQKIPKRYLEQTLQILVKNNILVGSRGPKGGYRLAKERRKIKVSDIIRTVTNDESKEICKSELSKKVIEPIINSISDKCFKFLDELSVEEVCKIAKEKKLQKFADKKVDFVI